MYAAASLKLKAPEKGSLRAPAVGFRGVYAAASLKLLSLSRQPTVGWHDKLPRWHAAASLKRFLFERI